MDIFVIPEVRGVHSCPQICSSMLPGPGDAQGVPVLVPEGSGMIGDVPWCYTTYPNASGLGGRYWKRS